MEPELKPDLSGIPWIVVTPSVDSDAWAIAVYTGATEQGWVMVNEFSAAEITDGRPMVILTDDAERAVTAGATQIVAIIAEPETTPDRVAEIHNIEAPSSNWYASLLLARALALAPQHRVVTPSELSRRPESLALFDGRIHVVPPASKAEVSRRPAVAAAFRMYRNLPKDVTDEIDWSEKLLDYDPRAARDWVDWGVLDTTGRPRILVSGPYLSMPPGRWRARVRFAVDAEAAKRQYRLDWGTRADGVSEHISPGAPGIYEIDLDYEWAEVDVAEIRLILIEGSFMGTLMFQGMKVWSIPDTPSRATDHRFKESN